MQYIVDLFTNKLFLAPASAWIISQIIKTLIDCYRSGFCKERFVGGSGMPSSHVATVTGLVIITGIYFGTGGFEFVMALVLGIIVICDARGVRYETQRQGRALNNLNEERLEQGKQPLEIYKFKEKLGHTIPEVIAGIIIGVICTIVVYHLPF